MMQSANFPSFRIHGVVGRSPVRKGMLFTIQSDRYTASQTSWPCLTQSRARARQAAAGHPGEESRFRRRCQRPVLSASRAYASHWQTPNNGGKEPPVRRFTPTSAAAIASRLQKNSPECTRQRPRWHRPRALSSPLPILLRLIWSVLQDFEFRYRFRFQHRPREILAVAHWVQWNLGFTTTAQPFRVARPEAVDLRAPNLTRAKLDLHKSRQRK